MPARLDRRGPRAAARLTFLATTLVSVASLAACASSGSAGSTTAAAPSPAAGDAGGFVVTLGADTVALERFARVGDRLEGEVLQRTPTTVIGRYVLTLGPAGRPARVEYSLRRPDGSLPTGAPRSLTLTFAGDSITREILRDTVARQAFAMPGAFPYVTNSFALYESALRALRTTGADSGAMLLLGLGAAQSSPWPVRFVGPTAARVYYFGDAQQVTLDQQGRVLAVDATGTTNKVRVTRVSSLDLEALAKSYAAREASGAGLAQTTRDTVRAATGGATLWVDYGRPLTRGRRIFGAGGIVPPDTVWRTGANAATQLRTDRELVIGGATVPAGTYTLWTLPARDGSWTLIVNKQVGQWGTIYDAKQDLVRVPLRVEPVASPVERFTIGVEPQGQGGTLALSWDRTRLSVPFTVRP